MFDSVLGLLAVFKEVFKEMFKEVVKRCLKRLYFECIFHNMLTK